MSKQCRGSLCINCKHSLFSFLGEVRLQFRPDSFGAGRRRSEKSFVACVGHHIANDEIANIDGAKPISGPEAVPAISGICFFPQGCACLHGATPTGLDLLERPRCRGSQFSACPNHRSRVTFTLDLGQANEDHFGSMVRARRKASRGATARRSCHIARSTHGSTGDQPCVRDDVPSMSILRKTLPIPERCLPKAKQTQLSRFTSAKSELR